MVEEAVQERRDAAGPGSAPRPGPMAMCPMASMCKRMMDRPPSGRLLTLVGAVLVLAGVLTVIEPRILVWLAGTAFVLMGVMMLVMANLVRRLGRGIMSAEP